MSQPKLSRQKGFTIVELLIVIVVIGILAALVLTSFAGVQARARDTERQTDINSIASQLEAYYATKGYYPTTAELTTDTTVVAFVDANLKGLDKQALVAPNGTSPSSLDDTASPSAVTVYGYQASECDTSNVNCQGFTLSWRSEVDTASPVKTKVSVN